MTEHCPVCGGDIKISREAKTVLCNYCRTEIWVDRDGREPVPPGAHVIHIAKEGASILLRLMLFTAFIVGGLIFLLIVNFYIDKLFK